jgi:RHS repeat-associated protein
VKKITDILESIWDLPSEPTKDYSYNPGTNKLTGIQGGTPVTFGYDSNGNITSVNTRTYVYDLSNQLIRVLDNSVQIAEYVFNGFGQRIKKSAQSGIRIFHYDPWGHLIAETNQSGQMIAEYMYLGDQLLTMIKPGESAYYFHNDHLGTPQVLTDANGSIAWKAVYLPFGGTQILLESVENPFRFPGQYYDQETGLHYNYFRYYGPGIGRYLTPDPIGLKGGTNLFTYVANNPARFSDRLGLFDIIVNDPGGRTGPTYGGNITVTGQGGQTVTVPGSSWPNPTHPSPGIESGAYSGVYIPTGHQGQLPGVRIENGLPVPTLGPNPAQSGQEFATGINIHCGFSPTNRGSAGCVTIHPDHCQQVWGVLQPGETGTITIGR